MSALPPASGALFRAHDPLYARAYHAADQGRTPEEVAAALAAAFPDMPNPNYYLNPAAIAAMQRVRHEQKERDRAVANSEWRRQRGLPDAAPTHQARPEPFVGLHDY